MKNCLIIEDNNINAVNLINILAYTKMEYNILGITLNINKICRIIKENKVDLIIIDIISDSFNIEKFLTILDEINCFRNEKIIILFTDNLEIIDKYSSNCFINKICKKPCKAKEVIKYLKKECFEIDNKLNYNNIKNELVRLSFSTKYIGTQYLIECIYEVSKLKNFYNYNLFTDILPILSKKYNKSIDTIYGSIKQSIKIMFKASDSNIIVNYFKLCDFEKPGPKQIIERVLENLI